MARFFRCYRPRLPEEDAGGKYGVDEVPGPKPSVFSSHGGCVPPLLGRLAVEEESTTTRPWSTIYSNDDDRDEGEMLREQLKMMQNLQSVKSKNRFAAAQEVQATPEEEDRMKMLEEQYFVKICAREGASTALELEAVRRQAYTTARMLLEREKGSGSIGQAARGSSDIPSPFDYAEDLQSRLQTVVNCEAHERQFAEFERKAKAKDLIRLCDIPFPNSNLLNACLLESSEPMNKTSKNWSRRWHPDTWAKYNLDEAEREHIESAVLKVSMMIQEKRKN